MPSTNEFGVRYDRTAKIVTTLVCALPLLIGVVMQQPVVLLLNLLIVAGAFAYSPRGYTIQGADVVIRRPIGDVRIAQVTEARRASRSELAWAWRLFGSGGLFGYYGLFSNAALGRAWWYITHRDQVVLLMANGKYTLISPDDPDIFLATLAAPQPAGRQPDPNAPPSRAWIGAGVIGIAASGTVLLALFYAPGPPRYTITPQALEIADRFYPVTIAARDVDIDGIRVIDLVMDREWQPVARTNGFANPYYRAGWFRAANGRRIRMYRSDGKRLVLLPPKHDTEPVLLEVANPEAFLIELRRAWSG